MCGRFWLLHRHVVRMLMVDLLQIVICVWSEEPTICHRRNFAHLWTISAVDCHNHLCWSSAYLLHCLAITIGCVLLNPMIYAASMLPWLFFADMFLLQCCTLQSPAFLWIYNAAIFQTFALPHCYIGRITPSSCHQPPQYPSSGLCRQLSKWPLWHTSVNNKSDAQLHNSGFGSAEECSLCNVLVHIVQGDFFSWHPPWSKNVWLSECDYNPTL